MHRFESQIFVCVAHHSLVQNNWIAIKKFVCTPDSFKKFMYTQNIIFTSQMETIAERERALFWWSKFFHCFQRAFRKLRYVLPNSFALFGRKSAEKKIKLSTKTERAKLRNLHGISIANEIGRLQNIYFPVETSEIFEKEVWKNWANEIDTMKYKKNLVAYSKSSWLFYSFVNFFLSLITSICYFFRTARCMLIHSHFSVTFIVCYTFIVTVAFVRL